jgi:hypothetical protein
VTVSIGPRLDVDLESIAEWTFDWSNVYLGDSDEDTTGG